MLVKRIAAGLLFVAALAGPVSAAETAIVVSSCGGVTYDVLTPPSEMPLTQDTTGKLCVNNISASTGAPADATFITQTANATLTAEQALGALVTGIVKNTTTTGVLSIIVPATGIETWLATPSSANLNAALTDDVPTLAGANTFTTTQTITPATEVSPLVLTGGTLAGTTSRPLISGTQTWNNAGLTAIGISADFTNTSSNAASKLIRLRVGGVTMFDVQVDGQATFGSTLTVPNLSSAGYVLGGATQIIGLNSRFNFNSASDGIVSIGDNAHTSFTRLCFGPCTSSFPAVERSAAILKVKLGDSSANAALEATTVDTDCFTIAGTLPAAGVAGRRACVTNQLTTCAATGVAVTGGGAVTCPVFDNGTAWVGG